MADSNRALALRRNLQKHAGRAKELFRQNVRKADKTTDETFDEFVRNFNLQQCAAVRLAKEVKNYNNCIKALQAASASLIELVCELYEEDWIYHDKVQAEAKVLNKNWIDFHTTIDEQVVKPLAAYSEQFADVNNKILKRRRKLLDYDCCRHSIQSLEHSAKDKKKEESRIMKAKEQLAEKQSLYEAINSELMEELPALWDSRVSFLASNFQCLFIAEATFHDQSFKIFNDLNDIIESLAKEHEKGIYAIKRRCLEDQLVPTFSSSGLVIEEAFIAEGESSSSEYLSAETVIHSDNENIVSRDVEMENKKENSSESMHDKVKISPKASGEQIHLLENMEKVKDPPMIHLNLKTFSNAIEEISSEPRKTTSTTELKCPSSPDEVQFPPGVFYKVKANFQYVAEDADELSFDPGDIICVTDFDDPEQKEDGWLMGYKEGTDEKGLFPANFTSPMRPQKD